MFTLMTQSQFTKRAARVVRIAGKVEQEIHEIACSILDHTRVHGDFSQMLVLLNGLPKGQRVKGLAFWCSHFTDGALKFAVDPASKLYVGKLKDGWQATADVDFHVSEAMATSFADLTYEKAVEPIDVKKILKYLARNASNNDLREDGTPVVSQSAREFSSQVVSMIREAGLDKKYAA